jgi:hypothetical protein
LGQVCCTAYIHNFIGVVSEYKNASLHRDDHEISVAVLFMLPWHLLNFDIHVPLNFRLNGTTMARNFHMGIVTEHSMILAL